MANILEIIFKGTNQTDAAATGVKKSLDGISQSAKGVSASMDVAMGVLASTTLQRFGDSAANMLKTMVSEASEAQSIMAQLEAVIKSTGGAAGLSADEINDMATSFANMTAFEDDAILAGQTVLLQFTKIGKEVFPEATQAMLDLSARMGIDLPAAAKLVGKAMEGEFSSLQRFGIIFDDTTKKAIENLVNTGQIAEAQAIILEEINKRVGGAAEAQAKTWSGLMKGLKNDFNNALEEMGTAITDNKQIVGFFETLRAAIQGFTEWFGKQSDTTQTAIVGIVAAFALLAKAAPILISLKVLLGAGGLAGVFATLKTVAVGLFSTLVGGFTAVSLPVIALAAAIGALVAVIIINWKSLSTIFSQWGQLVSAVFKRAGYELSKFVNDFISKIRTLGRLTYNEWLAIGRAIPTAILNGIKAEWNLLITGIQGLIDKLLEKFDLKLEMGSPSKVFERRGVMAALGFSQGFAGEMGIMAPALGASTIGASGYSGASQGRIGGGATVNVYGELSPEAQRRMRRQAEDIAYNAVKIMSGRRR